MSMNFILDSLFLTLVILCVILLFRLIRLKLMRNHRSLLEHAVVLPIEYSDDNTREFKLSYELPFDTQVTISLLDSKENLLNTIIDKSQKAGNYYIKQVLPEGHLEFFLLFNATDTKVMRRINLN